MLTLQVRRHRYGFSPELVADVNALLSASRETGDPAQIAPATLNAAVVYLCGHELEQADLHLTSAHSIAEQIGSADVRIKCLTYRAVLERIRGDMAATGRAAADALDAVVGIGPPTYVGMARANLAWVEWRQGRPCEAILAGQAALDLWQREERSYPFKWAALFPLLAIAGAEWDLARATQLARLLLEPSRHILPPELAATLEHAVAAAGQHDPPAAVKDLERAVALARAGASFDRIAPGLRLGPGPLSARRRRYGRQRPEQPLGRRRDGSRDR